MILDSLKNAGLYQSINPRFKKAFEFLQNTDLTQLPLGKSELDGPELFINVVEGEGKTAEVAIMETHKKYIDIQVPVTASETMGWIAVDKLSQPTQEYNSEKDVAFLPTKQLILFLFSLLNLPYFFLKMHINRELEMA